MRVLNDDLMPLLSDEDLDLVEVAAASPALPLDVMHQLVDRAIVS
jgi:predicted transcriptional regulator